MELPAIVDVDVISVVPLGQEEAKLQVLRDAIEMHRMFLKTKDVNLIYSEVELQKLFEQHSKFFQN